MSDPRTITAYDEHADEYADRFDQDKPGADLKHFIELLPQNAMVLDLGCGTGGASAHMAQAGLNVLGIDASEKMLSHARMKSDAVFKVALFDDITEIDTYDGLWANFSLLHAARCDMSRHLRTIHRALKPCGLFHIAMKTGEGESRDRINRKYTFYKEEELKSLLENTGFCILQTKTGSEKGLAGTIDPWIKILARRAK